MNGKKPDVVAATPALVEPPPERWQKVGQDDDPNLERRRECVVCSGTLIPDKPMRVGSWGAGQHNGVHCERCQLRYYDYPSHAASPPTDDGPRH